MEGKSFLNDGTKKSFTVVILKKFRNDGTKNFKRFLDNVSKKVC